MDNRKLTESEAIALAEGALQWANMNEAQMINANELTTDINKAYNDETKNEKLRRRIQRENRST